MPVVPDPINGSNTKSLSLDSSTKEKIAELRRQGMKPSEISRELNIGVASVFKFRNVG